MKHVRRETLNADDQMRTRVRLGIEANTGLQIEEWSDCAAVKCLDLSVLERPAKLAFTFGLEHEAIDVTAIPGLRIPDIARIPAFSGDTCFEPLDHDHAGLHRTILARQLCTRWRHRSIAPDLVRCVARPFKCTRRDSRFWRRSWN